MSLYPASFSAAHHPKFLKHVKIRKSKSFFLVRVSEIYEIDPKDILSKGKQRKRVKARSLFCHWAVNELGVSLTELARRIGISVPAIGYSVQRGEMIAKENGFQLMESET